MFTKRPPVATTVPSGMKAFIGTLVYRGIPFDLRSRAYQFYHLPGALLPQRLQVANSFKWASPPSILQKRHLRSLFMITFSAYDKKSVLFDEIYPPWLGIYLAPFAKCDWRINRPTTVNRLKFLNSISAMSGMNCPMFQCSFSSIHTQKIAFSTLILLFHQNYLINLKSFSKFSSVTIYPQTHLFSN